MVVSKAMPSKPVAAAPAAAAPESAVSKPAATPSRRSPRIKEVAATDDNQADLSMVTISPFGEAGDELLDGSQLLNSFSPMKDVAEDPQEEVSPRQSQLDASNRELEKLKVICSHF